MHNPLVSIIIPVYNAEKYLDESIGSAINQTWKNIEIIIVDDGSADQSLNTALKYQAENIKVFHQENKGASAARNKGLLEANGDYIQFLDADDLLSADKVEEQINCLSGSTAHLALCNTAYFNDNEDYVNGIITNSWFCNDSNDPVDFLIKLCAGNETMPGYGGMIQPNAWLTPRNLIEKAGQWNEELSVDDDGEFFCRVLLVSKGIKFNPKGLNYYRKFNNQQSLSGQKNYEGLRSSVKSIDLKFNYIKAKTGGAIVDRVFARHYWWAGVLAYPQFKALSKYCIRKGTELGYSGEKYIGGPDGLFYAKILGWKFARILSFYKHAFKRFFLGKIAI